MYDYSDCTFKTFLTVQFLKGTVHNFNGSMLCIWSVSENIELTIT